MLLEVSLILHANPLATIAARRFASVTTAGSGAASKSVAHVGVMTEGPAGGGNWTGPEFASS